MAGDFGDVERYELGPPQRRSEADEDEGAITMRSSGILRSALASRSAVSAVFFVGAERSVRAIPASVAFTPACTAGLS